MAEGPGLASSYQDYIVGRGADAPGEDAKERKEATEDSARSASNLYVRGRTYDVQAPEINGKYETENRSNVAGNIGQQKYLTDNLRDIMEGKDTTGAAAVMQQGIDKSTAAQMAAARSARGVSGQGGAMRGAQQQAAEMQGTAANNSAILQSQQAMQAANTSAQVFGNVGNQLGNQYSSDQAAAVEQARLKSEAARQKQAMELGLTGLSLQAKQQQLQSMYQKGQISLDEYKAQLAGDQQAADLGGEVLGGISGAIGGLMMSDDKAKMSGMDYGSSAHGGGLSRGLAAGSSFGSKMNTAMSVPYSPDVGSDAWAAKVEAQPMAQYTPMTSPTMAPSDPTAPAGTNAPAWLDMYSSGEGGKMSTGQMMGMAKMFSSDERGKSLDKEAASKDGRRLVDQFMDSLDPLAYHYKDPADEPRAEPTGGKYLGVSAQDMERAPKVGHQIVVDTPEGKKVSTQAASSAALASIARLNERVRDLEGVGDRKAG